MSVGYAELYKCKVSIISVINDIANIMNKIQTSTFVQTKNAIRFIFLLKIYPTATERLYIKRFGCPTNTRNSGTAQPYAGVFNRKYAPAYVAL